MIEDRIEVNIAGGLDIALPPMAGVRQKFATTRVDDIAAAVAREFGRAEIRSSIGRGACIAVGCGSRGVANYAQIARAVIAQIKALGGDPFVFPAMGSHGAATAEGQRRVLEGAGITEDYVGAPIRASMDTIEAGRMADGTPVYADAIAAAADGIVLINRIKPHTTFRGAIESGITKMLALGMGKIRGAAQLHTHGMDRFPQVLPEAARVVMARLPFLFGVAAVENAHEDTALLECISAARLLEREPELLVIARDRMARLYFDDIDVLVIDEMGKEISGTGFDPNVTGRQKRNVDWPGGPRIKKIAVLSLTERTHGNATGVGSADVITMRLYRAIDVGPTYANVITATYLDGAAIPMIMNTDREAVQLAVKSILRV
ncbi:MAG: DUF2088 domain-containing protein [Burkholderiales bacterium]|nr:DUF2088 domain-containing protein [Burkholderiales bacterium]